MAKTFEVDGTTYEIAYTIKRIEMYETVHGPYLTLVTKNNGWFSILELCDLVAYGLKAEGGEYVNPAKGREMAEGIVEANGYHDTYNAVIEAMRRDCGFFYRTKAREA